MLLCLRRAGRARVLEEELGEVRVGRAKQRGIEGFQRDRRPRGPIVRRVDRADRAASQLTEDCVAFKRVLVCHDGIVNRRCGTNRSSGVRTNCREWTDVYAGFLLAFRRLQGDAAEEAAAEVLHQGAAGFFQVGFAAFAEVAALAGDGRDHGVAVERARVQVVARPEEAGVARGEEVAEETGDVLVGVGLRSDEVAGGGG